MNTPDPALAALLGDPAPDTRRRRGLAVALALLLLGAAGAGLWAWSRPAARPPVLQTEPLRRGDLALAVSANGKIQPTRSVNIGSELSGTVARVLVDVNDRVRRGQVLVELDTAKLKDQIERSRASLASAQAGVVQAEAAVVEARANLARLEEVRQLSGGQVPAPAELDTARAALDKAGAARDTARATVTQARATLSTDETNLARASIRSPIDGVVLTRAVDPGNAVAASLQAVTLFTIAEDLRQLQLSVNVDEADVAQVREGQTAQFTVSAWPGRRYPAEVTRVAYGSTLTDNVVTYSTLLTVANPDLSLRPGMTAVATIATQTRQGVWLVPARALRYTPAAATAADGGAPGAPGTTGAGGASGGSSLLAQLMPRPPGLNRPARRTGGAEATAAGAAVGQSARLWVRDGAGQAPRPIEVTLGLSNGRLTEVDSADLHEGLEVVIGEGSGAAPGTNPAGGASR